MTNDQSRHGGIANGGTRCQEAWRRPGVHLVIGHWDLVIPAIIRELVRE
jgi:hypothetical protein